jgi:hypothetical protein
LVVIDLLRYQKACSEAMPGSPADCILRKWRDITPETASRFGVGYDSKQQCIVFPYWKQDGSIHWFKLRDNNGQRYTDKGKGVIPFGLSTLADQERVFVCEGETDTLRLAQELPEEAVIGIPGAQSIGCLKDYLPEGVTLYTVFDTDKAGKMATLKAIEKYGVRPVILPGDVKDVCEYFQAGHSLNDFLELVADADALAVESKSEIDAMMKHVSALPVGVLMSEVQPERVTWLWAGRIPQGKLTVMDGNPGEGKSTLTLELAARISRGHAMPGGSSGGKPAGVVILSAEDGPGDTIRPRLEAAGADLNRIVALSSCPDKDGGHPPVLPDDLEWIKKAIERVDAKLVIIDPLMAFLSGQTNSHRDQDVRRVLARMADLAEETGSAILVIRHLNKMSGGNALYRGGGSIGIIGAARSGLLVGRDPGQGEDGEGRVLASTKCNLAAKLESLSFHLVATEANGIPTSRVIWDGTSAHDANALLAQAEDGERGALEEAIEFLEDELASGPVAIQEIKRLAREAGISERTLQRAKEARKIKSHKQGMHQGWIWELPKIAKGSKEFPINTEDCQTSNTGNLGNLRESGNLREPEILEPELDQLKQQGRLSV